MSKIAELFAPKFMNAGDELTPEIEADMATAIGADSLRYLSRAAISRSVELPVSSLCQACIDGRYPTLAGKQLYEEDLTRSCQNGCPATRVFDEPVVIAAK
jgi:amidophosphoribosyltransferase